MRSVWKVIRVRGDNTITTPWELANIRAGIRIDVIPIVTCFGLPIIAHTITAFAAIRISDTGVLSFAFNLFALQSFTL
jgi:hypothetical protein